MHTKSRNSVALGVPYDEGVVEGSGQLLRGQFQPVLGSNEVGRFHIEGVFVGNFAYAWIPKLWTWYWHK